VVGLWWRRSKLDGLAVRLASRLAGRQAVDSSEAGGAANYGYNSEAFDDKAKNDVSFPSPRLSGCDKDMAPKGIHPVVRRAAGRTNSSQRKVQLFTRSSLGSSLVSDAPCRGTFLIGMNVQ